MVSEAAGATSGEAIGVPRALYPFDGRFFENAGQRQHYLDEGEGPPLLMVHGNPTWSFYYRRLVLGLRDTHRCLVPDHIGCGLSAKPRDADYSYRFERRVDDLERWVDSLRAGSPGVAPLGPMTLVAHDWGGMIGLALAVRRPELFSRFVLFNTAGFHNPTGKKLPFTLKLVRETPLGAAMVWGLNAFAVGATYMAVRRPLPAAVRRAYTAPYARRADRIATLRFVQDIPMKPEDPGFDLVTRTEAGLAGLADRPAAIFWGAKDFVFDDEFLARWRVLWPHASVTRFPDAGHYVLEDAFDEILPAVRRFLEESA